MSAQFGYDGCVVAKISRDDDFIILNCRGISDLIINSDGAANVSIFTQFYSCVRSVNMKNIKLGLVLIFSMAAATYGQG